MGLDQFAYKIKSYKKEYYNNGAIEIAYWRKHNRLQGYMENLYFKKIEDEKNNKSLEDRFLDALDELPEKNDIFNCVDLILDMNDILEIEKAIKNRELPETSGFFFGNDSYDDYNDYYKDTDITFIEEAKKALNEGYVVFYTCSW